MKTFSEKVAALRAHHEALLSRKNADNQEFFGPIPSTPCGADFKKLYETEDILFLKDIQYE